jgi:multiphosphoryl transfer protein
MSAAEEVGIVLVSHSRILAAATEQLIRQVTGPRARIACAAGVGTDHGELGTDATAIMEAIESLDSSVGTLVLMDMGSAVLSAETACSLLPDDICARVALCAAPFVEGAIAAAVAASAGAPLERVKAEAETALEGKREQVGGVPDGPSAGTDSELVADATLDVQLRDPNGLHMRPAARVVALLRGFDARVSVIVSGDRPRRAVADSMTALVALGTRGGDTVRLAASGPEAGQAVAALYELLSEPVEVEPRRQQSIPRAGAGLPASPGIAIGRPERLLRSVPKVPEHHIDDPEREWSRLYRAVDEVQVELGRMARERAGGDIMLAQLALLRDPELLGRAERAIREQHLNGALAWQRAIDEVVAIYAGFEEPYLRARARDVSDVGDRVLRVMLGDGPVQFSSGSPSILLVDDLAPSEAAALDHRRVLGVIDRAGGPTSHASIVLRAAGIPAVVGASDFDLDVSMEKVALDGGTGEIWCDPEEAMLAPLRRREAARRDEVSTVDRVSVVKLKDGKKVELWANVASRGDAQAAVEAGAYGIGLLRTEMLYLDRDIPPSEDEQVEALAEIVEPMKEQPVIVRALDAGADKMLPFMHLAPEQNPYLGVRGLRALLNAPDVFETQLRAFLRLGYQLDLRIMLPMVTEVAELCAAREVLERAHRNLVERAVDHLWPVPLGIMIEVPAVALMAETFAGPADFFSIGTNDLTQYALAAERNNGELGRFNDSAHPAVLQLCRMVADGASKANRPVSVCGEAAGDPVVAGLLVGLGINRLSMTPPALAAVRAGLSGLSGMAARSAAASALEMTGAQQARAALRRLA